MSSLLPLLGSYASDDDDDEDDDKRDAAAAATTAAAPSTAAPRQQSGATTASVAASTSSPLLSASTTVQVPVSQPQPPPFSPTTSALPRPSSSSHRRPSPALLSSLTASLLTSLRPSVSDSSSSSSSSPFTTSVFDPALDDTQPASSPAAALPSAPPPPPAPRVSSQAASPAVNQQAAVQSRPRSALPSAASLLAKLPNSAEGWEARGKAAAAGSTVEGVAVSTAASLPPSLRPAASATDRFRIPATAAAVSSRREQQQLQPAVNGDHSKPSSGSETPDNSIDTVFPSPSAAPLPASRLTGQFHSNSQYAPPRCWPCLHAAADTDCISCLCSVSFSASVRSSAGVPQAAQRLDGGHQVRGPLLHTAASTHCYLSVIRASSSLHLCLRVTALSLSSWTVASRQKTDTR